MLSFAVWPDSVLKLYRHVKLIYVNSNDLSKCTSFARSKALLNGSEPACTDITL